MIKSVLAVSEGGPDATMSFKLAARVAGAFGGSVDALHLPVGPAGGMVGGLAMSGEAMPLVMNLDDERLENLKGPVRQPVGLNERHAQAAERDLANGQSDNLPSRQAAYR